MIDLLEGMPKRLWQRPVRAQGERPAGAATKNHVGAVHLVVAKPGNHPRALPSGGRGDGQAQERVGHRGFSRADSPGDGNPQGLLEPGTTNRQAPCQLAGRRFRQRVLVDASDTPKQLRRGNMARPPAGHDGPIGSGSQPRSHLGRQRRALPLQQRLHNDYPPARARCQLDGRPRYPESLEDPPSPWTAPTRVRDALIAGGAEGYELVRARFHPPCDRLDSTEAASASCNERTTSAPSPTADATRLVEPRRTSPMAKTSGRVVSRSNGWPSPPSRCSVKLG